MKNILAACTALITLASVPAFADWAPTRPVELVVSGNAGGGSDTFARQIQAAIQKHDLNPTNMIVLDKGGGSGVEAFLYAKSNLDDPHKLITATNNEWVFPMVTKVGYAADDMIPVAVMAFDEFIIWVQPDAPYKTIMDMVDAGKANPGKIKFGGSQSKDTDQTLIRQIEAATGVQFTYVPFKSGAEAATQLAGKHIDANTDNPSETTGQWRAGQVRPLCVMSAERLADKTKVAGEMSWSDIPTCKEQGLPISTAYQQPRTVFMPGKAPAEAVTYYGDMLKKVSETPEFQNYLKTTSQTGRFLAGDDMKAYIKQNTDQLRPQFKKDGWLVD